MRAIKRYMGAVVNKAKKEAQKRFAHLGKKQFDNIKK